MKWGVKVPLLVGVVAIASLSAITIAVNKIVYGLLEHSTIESLRTEASINKRFIEARFEGQLSQIWEIANRARVRRMDWEEVQHTLMQDAPRIEDVLDFGLVFPNGIAKYVVDGNAANLGDRDYIKEAFSGKASASNLITSRVTGKPVIMLAAPIFKNDEKDAPVVGVLIARKDAKTLSNILKETNTYHKGGHSFIINDKGTIIAHSTDQDLVGRTKSGEAFARAIEEKNGIVFYSEDTDRIASFTEIKGYPWILFVSAEKAELDNSLAKICLIIILIVSICVISGIVVFIIMKKFNKEEI